MLHQDDAMSSQELFVAARAVIELRLGVWACGVMHAWAYVSWG